MFDLAAALLWGALLVAVILLTARLATRGLVWAEINHPGAAERMLWRVLRLLLILAVGVWLLGVIFSWPPRWLEQRQYRQALEQKVEAMGGWGIVKAECQMLVDSSIIGKPLQWHALMADKLPPLPPALASLDPVQVDMERERWNAISVRLQFFRFRSGYSVKIFCSTPTNAPAFALPHAPTEISYGRRRLAEGVYEQ